MYGLLVWWALVGAVLGAPSNCGEPCLGEQRPARLEDLSGGGDVGGAEPNGSSTWRDEKHYVTDDGKAQMSFQAGQTVGDNGSIKFASHSYRYGSHGSQPARPDAQVLGPAEFEQRHKQLKDSVLHSFASPDLASHFDQVQGMHQQFNAMVEEQQRHLDTVLTQLDQQQRQQQANLNGLFQEQEQQQQGIRCRRAYREKASTDSSSSSSSSSSTI